MSIAGSHLRLTDIGILVAYVGFHLSALIIWDMTPVKDRWTFVAMDAVITALVIFANTEILVAVIFVFDAYFAARVIIQKFRGS